MTRPQLFLAIAVAAAVASACGLLPGDESEYVYFHNTLDVAVAVGLKGDAEPWQPVKPGEIATNQWIVAGKRDGKRQNPGFPVWQVEAKTESGERVFCHRYTPGDLDGLKWTIEIKRSDECK
jgi:hypothetical protein